MKSNKQQGFTLIELIIVIVILGILAVTASPKFLDLTGDARESTISGLQGALKGGSNIIYSKALIEGSTAGTSASPVAVNSINTVFGYPEASVAAIIGVLDISAEAANNTTGTTTTGTEFEISLDATGNAATTVRIYPAGDFEGSAFDTDDSDCYVQYVEPTAEGNAPTITTVVTGC
jgi:MSHA pilin protein MshA